VELKLDLETEQLCKVLPQDETNYRRGIIEAYVTLHDIVGKTLEELDRYNAGKRKRDERARAAGEPSIAAFWGNSLYRSEFDKRGR
jgi:hypothetical protein